jgi:uncharacterized protein (TIGR02466 family)
MPLHQQYQNGLMLAWPTPILSKRTDAPEMLAGLRETILTKETEDPEGVERALVRGWHSATDLMDWPGAGISDLRGVIGDAVGEMVNIFTGDKSFTGQAVITAWANVSRRGGYHRQHTHHSSMLSGVFYVSTGIPDEDGGEFNGAISFSDPRVAVEMIQIPGKPFGDKIKVTPEPGLLLLFPSWLPHFVDPFHGEGERISIAFNVSLREHPPQQPEKKAKAP